MGSSVPWAGRGVVGGGGRKCQLRRIKGLTLRHMYCLVQGTMANGDGDKEEPAGYWAGRVPGMPMARPTDKTKG